MFSDLQPGQITKPLRVWVTSTSIRVAFYQAQPISATVVIFVKKYGSMFGTELSLPTASILGPDLSMRHPSAVETEYFEYEIKRLKPSTPYVIKVRSEDGRWSERSDRVTTLSPEEERSRNAEMHNFRGALVKLGEYDGSVLDFDPATGLYQVRVLQVDDVASSTQLVRFASDYTELGLGVHAYTLSSVRFGRWGGEIRGSRVVPEGELKWIVARAVQLEERSELHAGFDAKEQLLQARNERLQCQLEGERRAAQEGIRLTRLTYAAAAGAVAVAALLVCVLVGWRAQASQRRHAQEVERSQQQVHQLRSQLQQLELYRVSLELDTGRWLLHGLHASGSSSAAGAPGSGSSSSSESSGAAVAGEAAAGNGSSSSQESGCMGLSCRFSGSASQDPLDPLPSQPFPTTAHDALLSDAVLRHALMAAHGSAAAAGSQPAAAAVGGSSSSAGADAGRRAGAPGSSAPDEPPNPWTYVHTVSNLYALYLVEWMKHHMAQEMHSRVNAMLLPSLHKEDLLAHQQQQATAPGSAPVAAAAAAGTAAGDVGAAGSSHAKPSAGSSSSSGGVASSGSNAQSHPGSPRQSGAAAATTTGSSGSSASSTSGGSASGTSGSSVGAGSAEALADAALARLRQAAASA